LRVGRRLLLDASKSELAAGSDAPHLVRSGLSRFGIGDARNQTNPAVACDDRRVKDLVRLRRGTGSTVKMLRAA
jgi:hypothetical protein